jgi:hypothetical protein
MQTVQHVTSAATESYTAYIVSGPGTLDFW